MQSRFNGAAAASSGSSPFRSSSSPVTSSVNCALSSSPPPPPAASSDAGNAAAARAELAVQQRKKAAELKAQRSREYEERWREKVAQDLSEDAWASGWKQPIVPESAYGGWDYVPTPVAADQSTWTREFLSTERVNYNGWDQLPSSSETEDAPLGGWAAPDPSQPFDDYQTEVKILGQKVMVTVASKGATVEKWLDKRKEVVKYGLDIEWRPTFQKGDYHYAALLQLSHEGCCLLIQLQFIDKLPDCLKTLLADPTIMKGGVGIMADTKKLKNDCDLICAGQVELTTLASTTLKNSSFKKAGIATLTDKILGVSYKKNKRATMSNWEIRDLTHAQIQYAAADAWLSYSILMALLNYKEPPPPQTVNNSEEATTVSGNMAADDGVQQPSYS